MSPEELFLAAHGRPKIDYQLVAKAIEFYLAAGFEYIEVPWIVPIEYNKITFEGPFPFETSYGVLVGSAEQALIYMLMAGALSKNKKYVTASPCFRDDLVDATHQKSFFKVELFCATDESYDSLLICANEFLKSVGIECLVEQQSAIQHDLLCNNIELGSYGSRIYNEIKWNYGTGLAEPRTSGILNGNYKA